MTIVAEVGGSRRVFLLFLVDIAAARARARFMPHAAALAVVIIAWPDYGMRRVRFVDARQLGWLKLNQSL